MRNVSCRITLTDYVSLDIIIKDKIDISQEGYELKFLSKNYAKMLASLHTETIIVSNDVHNSQKIETVKRFISAEITWMD